MSATQETKISFPRLDPLRALCFLLVFFFHGMHTTDPVIRDHWSMHLFKGHLFGSGNLGVNIFFVLSGFLITYLLLAEQRVFRRIDVPQFWLRRVLRIWPLYYACIAFGFLLFPIIKEWVGLHGEEIARPWMYLTFLSNFDVIYNGPPDASSLGLLWSIAVEEQFYLVWPLLLTLTPTRVYPILFSFMITGAWTFCLFNDTEDMVHYHTLARMGDLSCGALGAWLVSRDSGSARVAALPKWSVVAVHAFFLVLYLNEGRLTDTVGRPTYRLLFSAFATFMVVWQAVGSAKWFALPTWAPLNYLGRISYGLYCLHPIALMVAVQGQHMLGLDTHVWHIVILQTVIGLGLSIALAAASYHFYESPFLRLKQRFSHIHR